MRLLVSWDAQTLQTGTTFGGGAEYSSDEAQTAANMTATVANGSWTITDGGDEYGQSNTNIPYFFSASQRSSRH